MPEKIMLARILQNKDPIAYYPRSTIVSSSRKAGARGNAGKNLGTKVP